MLLHGAGSSRVCVVPSVWQCGRVEFIKTDLIWLIAGHFSQVSGHEIFGAFFFLGIVPRKSEQVATQLRWRRVGYAKKNSRPGVNCLSVIVSFLNACVITSYRSYLMVIIILIIIIIIIAMYITSTFVFDVIF